MKNRSVGHNYNIMDINKGKMITVEAASNGRWSQKEIGAEPSFHANMYMRLQVKQVLSLYPFPRTWLLFYWFSYQIGVGFVNHLDRPSQLPNEVLPAFLALLHSSISVGFTNPFRLVELGFFMSVS